VLSARDDARGIVIVAHERLPGATSERSASRSFLESKLASLRFRRDSPSDRVIGLHGGVSDFDVRGMARRIVATTDWLGEQPELRHLAIGYMGSGAAAGAVLMAASRRAARVRAVVLHAGQPDLAGRMLAAVKAPTLLIVGGRQLELLERNEAAFARLRCDKRLVLLADSAESGRGRQAAEEAVQLARRYFARRLSG
jgi:putative phosphoribosyl transferase